MSFHAWLTALRRRWYLLLLVGFCTAVGMWSVHTRAVAYKGCDSLYLSSPATTVQGNPNVYLNDNPSLPIATRMATVEMASKMPSFEHRLQLSLPGAESQVAQTNTGSMRFPSYNLPTVQVCATAPTPRLVVRATTSTTAQFRAVLYQMQTRPHIPRESQISAAVLARDVPYAEVGRPKLAYVGVLIVGVLGGIPLALWADELLISSGRRSSMPNRAMGQFRRLRRQ